MELKPRPIVNVNVLGVDITPIRSRDLNEYIGKKIRQNERALVLNVNIHALNLAFTRPWLCKFFNRAELVFCDGAGVKLAARLLGQNIPQRITYADWMWEAAGYFEKNGISLYFLGGHPGIAQKAAKRLHKQFPRLLINGVHDGYFDRTDGSLENENVVRAINESNSDVLIIGLGMPLQEKWLMENWHRLNTRIGLTGGAVFDYISGNLRRPPAWMTNHGLEWLGRLIIEPSRLWRRYIVGNPIFIYRVLKQRLGFLHFES